MLLSVYRGFNFDQVYIQQGYSSSRKPPPAVTYVVANFRWRLCLGNFALNYLASRQGLDSFVQQALISLICRLTKTGWFDSVEGGPDWPFRDILESANKFIEVSG